MRIRCYATLYLRLAVAAGFLTSVSDRFGLWGRRGTTNVAWGDFQQFAAYTAQLNPWAPAALVQPLAWFVTIAETVLGLTLVVGLGTRYAALASGVLMGLFALGLMVGTGAKSALNYSVFTASAGAFALATARSYRWSLDALLAPRAQHGEAIDESTLGTRRSEQNAR
jgi:thiosulfate dehydrogenase [quinone] large subunit